MLPPGDAVLCHPGTPPGTTAVMLEPSPFQPAAKPLLFTKTRLCLGTHCFHVIGNVMLLVLTLLVPVFASVLIPCNILAPHATFCTSGLQRQLVFLTSTMFAFGLIGYLTKNWIIPRRLWCWP
jgi:hypothetical protein